MAKLPLKKKTVEKAEKPKTKVNKPEPEAPKLAVAPEKEMFKAVLTSSSTGIVYNRIGDKLSYEELAVKVAESSKYPIRLLMREERVDKVITEMIILHIGAEWITCLDVNSVTPENKNSIFRLGEKDYASKKFGAFPFQVYERVEPAQEKPKGKK